jgi:hypothetical protein
VGGCQAKETRIQKEESSTENYRFSILQTNSIYRIQGCISRYQADSSFRSMHFNIVQNAFRREQGRYKVCLPVSVAM